MFSAGHSQCFVPAKPKQKGECMKKEHQKVDIQINFTCKLSNEVVIMDQQEPLFNSNCSHYIFQLISVRNVARGEKSIIAR